MNKEDSSINPETLFADYDSRKAGNFFRKTSEEELRWQEEQEKLRRLREAEDRRREAYKRSEEALHRIIGSDEFSAAAVSFLQDRGDSSLHNLMLKRKDLRPLPSKFVEDFCRAARVRRKAETGLVLNFLDTKNAEIKEGDPLPITARVIQHKGMSTDKATMRLDNSEDLYSKDYRSSFNDLIQLYEVCKDYPTSPHLNTKETLPYEDLKEPLVCLFEGLATNQQVYEETTEFSKLFIKGLVELKSYYLVLTCFEYALKRFSKTTEAIEEKYKTLSAAAQRELEETSPGFGENLERAVEIKAGLKELYEDLENEVRKLTLSYLNSNAKSYIKLSEDLAENSVSASEKRLLQQLANQAELIAPKRHEREP